MDRLLRPSVAVAPLVGLIGLAITALNRLAGGGLAFDELLLVDSITVPDRGPGPSPSVLYVTVV